MNRSIWSIEKNNMISEPLTGNIRTDVLIIGGGISGILCAYKLHEAGVDYILVESDRICSGITENTTAKITVQHGLIYDKLIRRFGKEIAKLYYRANDSALQSYRELCKNTPCDLEERSAYVYSADDRGKIEKELKAYESIGANAEFAEAYSLPFSVAGAVKVSGQAQFHPLKFLETIAKDLNIHENTVVRELRGTKAITDRAVIDAKKVIVASHFPFVNKHGSYFLKMYQHRSYVIALDNAENVRGMYVDEADRGMSFRNSGDFLLLGGGGHRTGKTGGAWQELENFAAKHYPGSKVITRWAAQDCMTLDSIPYIGKYSASTDNLYVITGFNKWGMTSAMAGAEVLRDMVMGRVNEYSELFSPSRSIVRPQLALNGLEALISLCTPTTKRCPHMGCALKWNVHERTWDCPCHGSRFSVDGTVIDNPAAGDLKMKEKNDEQQT